MITFDETSNLGRGSFIKVYLTTKVGPKHSQHERLKGKPVKIEIGRIEISQNGKFRYFEPKENEINPIMVSDDLEKLKKQIKELKKQNN